MMKVRDNAELSAAARSFFEKEGLLFDKERYLTDNDELSFAFKDEATIQRLFVKNYENNHSKKRSFEVTILSCIALLGVCDIKTIKAYASLLYDQALIDGRIFAMISDSDRVRNILKKHISTTGLLIKHNFLLSDTEADKTNVALYLPTRPLIHYLRSIYSKEVSDEISLAMLSPQRLSGKALTNMVALRCADMLDCYDVRYVTRDFRTPAAGKMQTDATLYVEGTSKKAYIGFVSLCFDDLSTAHLKSDFNEYLRQRMELIKQFEFYYRNRCDESAVICVCSSLNDLIMFADELVNSFDAPSSLYFRLYFTSEKAFKDDFTLGSRFLTLSETDNGSYRIDTCELQLFY